MPNKPSPFTGMDLSSTVRPNQALDQRLFDKTSQPPKEAKKQEGEEASKQTSEKALPERVKTNLRLHPDALEAFEDMRRILRRTYGIKINQQELMDEVLLAMFADMEVNHEESVLAKKLRGKEAKKQS